MSYLRIMSGALGSDDQIGSGIFTAPGGKKIVAVGIVADAEITNFKFTQKAGKENTESSLAWMGVTLLAATPANAVIPLGEKADSVSVASGSVRMFYDGK